MPCYWDYLGKLATPYNRRWPAQQLIRNTNNSLFHFTKDLVWISPDHTTIIRQTSTQLIVFIFCHLLCWPTSVIGASQFSKLMLKNNESINYVRWIVIHHCNSSGGYLAVCQFWWTLINVAWNCGENIFAFLKHCVYNLAVFVLIGTGVNTLLK